MQRRASKPRYDRAPVPHFSRQSGGEVAPKSCEGSDFLTSAYQVRRTRFRDANRAAGLSAAHTAGSSPTPGIWVSIFISAAYPAGRNREWNVELTLPLSAAYPAGRIEQLAL
jgi:hypothetical protein